MRTAPVISCAKFCIASFGASADAVDTGVAACKDRLCSCLPAMVGEPRFLQPRGGWAQRSYSSNICWVKVTIFIMGIMGSILSHPMPNCKVCHVIWRMRRYRGMGAGLAGWCAFLESAEPAMAADMCLSVRVTRGHTQGRPGSAPSGQLLCNVLVRSGLRRYRTCVLA
jgi:hypothetical protein